MMEPESSLLEVFSNFCPLHRKLEPAHIERNPHPIDPKPDKPNPFSRRRQPAMRFLLPSTPADGRFFLRRLLSSSYSSSAAFAAAAAAATVASPTKLKNLSYRHRARALNEARIALIDYLHTTRSLPFSVADHLVSNSPISLASLVSQVSFGDSAPSQFSSILRRFLSYRPASEFDFFFESIGLPPSHPSLPYRSPLFLSDDQSLLAALSSLLRFGFPWNLLGLLYIESPSIFSAPTGRLFPRLQRFESLGFRRLSVIAIILAFPYVLVADDDDVETGLLFRDLKTVLVDYGLDSCCGDDVEVLLRLCQKIRLFYDAGSEKGGLGELMGRNQRIFVELDESVIAQKLSFFMKLGMRKDEVGHFVLKNAEIFRIDLDSPEILLPEYLIRVGLSRKDANFLMKRYPYVMGKNKLGNLPAIMRTLDLHKWFLACIVDEKNLHFLSPSYVYVDSRDNTMETEFLQDIERIKLVKQHQFVDAKVEFFLNIGFGKNKRMSKMVWLVNGSREQLQERFDCLIGLGLEYPMLCRMISATPKLLNQSKDMILEKANYLCRDLGYPLEYLDSFPAFLCFDLENRTKPRYRILNWLSDIGLVKKPFAPATILANSEKRFIFNLQCIHPAAPKQWFECFSSQNDSIDKRAFN